MKKLFFNLMAFLAFLVCGYSAMAQRSYEMELYNLVQFNEAELRFDVRFKNTAADPITNFIAVEMMQFQVGFNPQLLNGGAFNNTYLQYVNGTTDLVGQSIVPVSTNVTTNQVVIQWGTQALPLDGVTTYINHNNWVRIGTFKAILKKTSSSANSHNYASVTPDFYLVTNQVLCNWCNVNEGLFNPGEYTRADPNYYLISNKTVTNSVANKKLFSHCFTGTGNYTNPLLWNNAVHSSDASYHVIPALSNANVSVGAVSATGAAIPVPGVMTLSDTRTLNDFTIRTTSSVTMAVGSVLTVNGVFYKENPDASALLLQSANNSVNASLIHNTPGVTAVVQRHIPGSNWLNAQDGWHFLGSPVIGQAVSPAFVAGNANEYDFYTWHESSNTWVNYKNNAVEPTWNSCNSNSGQFLMGKGYMTAYKDESIREFAGELNTEGIVVSGLTHSAAGTNRGWHLLGNPFPCGLIWNQGWLKVSVSGVSQIWKEADMDYCMVLDGDVIPSTNGFMVEVEGTEGSVIMPLSARTGNTMGCFKKSNQSRLKMVVRDLQDNSAKECYVIQDEQSTSNFDLEYDGHYLQGFGPKFYAFYANEKLSVNALPEFNEGIEIPLVFQKKVGNSYSFECTGVDEFPLAAYLLDKKTNIDYNLKSKPSFTFTSEQDDVLERFSLHFKTVGIGDEPQASVLSAFYSNGNLCFQNCDGFSFEVFSMNGQKVYNGLVSKQQIPVNLSAGFYIVKIFNSNQVQSLKIQILK